MVGKEVNDAILNEEFIKGVRDQVEKKTGKTTEQLFKEREKRVNDTIHLKVPDRVPVVFNAGYFHYRYAGMPLSKIYFDPGAYKEAVTRTLIEFQPDVLAQAFTGASGLALEMLGDTQTTWAGGSFRSDTDTQFLDREIMRDHEYDLLMTDPGDFILRYYLPRRFKALEALSKLPPLTSLMGNRLLLNTPIFASPDVVMAFDILAKAGQEQSRFRQWDQEISELVGIPLFYYPGGLGEPPFDFFVTYLRGMRSTMIDILKRPEKLLAAMERVLEWRLARAVPAKPEERGKKRVRGGGNHFQSEEFLSRKQFDTFIWPTWKKSLLTMIDLGFVPRIFMEGKNDDRIEHFLELPKGKAFIHFEKIDMARAKDMLGSHICITGNVPAALMWGGSPQEVEDYCRDLIKVCGKNGGFMLNTASSLDDAKPANVKAMIDAAKKYGQY